MPTTTRSATWCRTATTWSSRSARRDRRADEPANLDRSWAGPHVDVRRPPWTGAQARARQALEHPRRGGGSVVAVGAPQRRRRDRRRGRANSDAERRALAKASGRRAAPPPRAPPPGFAVLSTDGGSRGNP